MLTASFVLFISFLVVAPFTLAGKHSGGHVCSIQNFPYMVSLSYEMTRTSFSYRHFCGGTLVSRYWVITAAYCVKNLPIGISLDSVIVTAGLDCFESSNDSNAIQRTFVKKFFTHPNYNKTSGDGDLAFVRLVAGIDETSHVKYVIMSVYLREDSSEERLSSCGTTAIAPGWDFWLYCLHCFGVHLMKQEGCIEKRNIYYKEQQLKKHLRDVDALDVLCAREAGEGVCIRDSGGPLMCDGVQIAVVTGGAGCSNRGFPIFYTLLSKYEDFIYKIVATYRIHKGDVVTSASRRQINFSAFEFSIAFNIFFLCRAIK